MYDKNFEHKGYSISYFSHYDDTRITNHLFRKKDPAAIERGLMNKELMSHRSVGRSGNE